MLLQHPTHMDREKLFSSSEIHGNTPTRKTGGSQEPNLPPESFVPILQDTEHSVEQGVIYD